MGAGGVCGVLRPIELAFGISNFPVGYRAAYDASRAMTFTAAARILLPLAVLPLLPAQVRFYRTMEIDPGSLVLRFSNEFPLRAGFPTEEYFQHSGIHVEHVVPLGRNQPVSHPDFSYVSRDLVLQQRRKFQEQFSGSFGAIIAESAYSYPGLDYGSPEIGFSVRSDSNKTGSMRRAPCTRSFPAATSI